MTAPEQPQPLLALLIRPGVVVVVIVATVLALRAWGVTSPHGLAERVTDHGAWSMVAFAVLYAVLTVALVPGSIPSAAAGIVFGTTLGLPVVIVGATLGASLAFLVARSALRPLAERVAARSTARIDRFLDHRDFISVLIVRLVPLVPFNASNYAFGLTTVRAWPFVAATAIGMIPATIVRVWFGSTLTDPGSNRFWEAGAALVAMSAATMTIAVVVHRRSENR